MEWLAGEIALGVAVAVASIFIHGGATFVLAFLRLHIPPVTRRNYQRRLVLVMSAALVVLMVAHILEIVLWARAYIWIGTVGNPLDAFYFAFVNYTTLGYGDMLPAPESRLLGPVAAGSGILMFGWSTAIMAQILSRHLAVFDRPDGGDTHGGRS
ncbi:potassium channel family protein [Pseudoxanthobacter sp.]|uniref:potassium channel family protein n=1 Tax=Pseudoxanthobacter sp. TaxID=1925742 RepID=UPI002FE35CBB